MATIAVMLALGGTGYAAATISGRDMGSLTGADVRNSSATATIPAGSHLALGVSKTDSPRPSDPPASGGARRAGVSAALPARALSAVPPAQRADRPTVAAPPEPRVATCAPPASQTAP